MALQESGEMYLESILILSRTKGAVRSIDISQHLGYSKPSVSRAVGLLKSGGYILVDEDGHIALTDSGKAVAEKILSPMEKQQFDAADDPHKTLLTFWVLKEAAAKLSGEGLKGYPNHTEFILPHKAVQEIHGCLVAILEEENHVI